MGTSCTETPEYKSIKQEKPNKNIQGSNSPGVGNLYQGTKQLKTIAKTCCKSASATTSTI